MFGHIGVASGYGDTVQSVPGGVRCGRGGAALATYLSRSVQSCVLHLRASVLPQAMTTQSDVSYVLMRYPESKFARKYRLGGATESVPPLLWSALPEVAAVRAAAARRLATVAQATAKAANRAEAPERARGQGAPHF